MELGLAEFFDYQKIFGTMWAGKDLFPYNLKSALTPRRQTLSITLLLLVISYVYVVVT